MSYDIPHAIFPRSSIFRLSPHQTPLKRDANPLMLPNLNHAPRTIPYNPLDPTPIIQLPRLGLQLVPGARLPERRLRHLHREYARSDLLADG